MVRRVYTFGTTARGMQKRIDGKKSASSITISPSRISSIEKEDKAGRICRSVAQRV